MPHTLTSWFDGLEEIMEREASLYGLFEHGATTGQAREFIVRTLLRSILPAAVEIGSGIVIDTDVGRSRQIDVIIYDPRFPALRSESSGIYLVEGVIAAIEVKSRIDSLETLTACLENCGSVARLRINGQSNEEFDARVAFYQKLQGVSKADAEARAVSMFAPATYVVGISSELNYVTLGKCAMEWWQKNSGRHYCPLLPRVISAGHTVAFTADGRMSMRAANDKESLLSVWQSERRFRWFAVHIMDLVSRRLGQRHFGEERDFAIDSYFPLQRWLEELDRSKVACFQMPSS